MYAGITEKGTKNTSKKLQITYYCSKEEYMDRKLVKKIVIICAVIIANVMPFTNGLAMKNVKADDDTAAYETAAAEAVDTADETEAPDGAVETKAIDTTDTSNVTDETTIAVGSEADASPEVETDAQKTVYKPVNLSKPHELVAELKAGTVLTQAQVDSIGADHFFYAEEISDETFARMWLKSYKENCTVPREELRYIRCLHCDIDGNIKVGELVMNVSVADTVCNIFRQLYDAKYPIESMILVDDFNADDETSIMSNNTSAFNFRTVDNTDEISNHAYGLAIDINPYYNVYYIASENYIFPEDGWQYLDRESDFPYKIEVGDLCYNLFTEAGFEWGGWWTYNTDYQHFQYVNQ